MPIKSTKPSQRGPYKGKEPTPRMGHYALESEITNTSQARREINGFNRKHLRLTQPYSRAAELRAGQAFPKQQKAGMAAERVGAAPYRGFGSVSLGKRRSLPDVGP